MKHQDSAWNSKKHWLKSKRVSKAQTCLKQNISQSKAISHYILQQSRSALIDYHRPSYHSTNSRRLCLHLRRWWLLHDWLRRLQDYCIAYSSQDSIKQMSNPSSMRRIPFLSPNRQIWPICLGKRIWGPARSFCSNPNSFNPQIRERLFWLTSHIRCMWSILFSSNHKRKETLWLGGGQNRTTRNCFKALICV